MIILSDAYLAQLKIFEASVPWMYLDGPGNVTVATGHLLVSPMAAGALPFEGGDPEVEYWLVKRAKPNLGVNGYRELTTSRLTGAAMDALLRTDVFGRSLVLEGGIPDITRWPQAIQEVLFDMVFNMGLGVPGGTHGLLSYKEMLAALRSGNMTVAAAQSHRTGIQSDRNDWAAAQILSCS